MSTLSDDGHFILNNPYGDCLIELYTLLSGLAASHGLFYRMNVYTITT